MIKKGDFVELDYTGRLKDDKIVFDTTVEEIAKASDNHNPKYQYKPAIVCIGEHHLIAGLDDAMIGKNPGKYTVEVKAEHGFGKKSAELLKLLPMKLFIKDNIQPFPGLDVNVDGQLGIVRSVSGGRVIVDFNHPLASKDLVYEVDVKRIVSDPLEQVKALMELIQIPIQGADIFDEKAVVFLKSGLPDEMTKDLSEHIMKLTHLKAVEFTAADKKAAHEHKPEDKKEGQDDSSA